MEKQTFVKEITAHFNLRERHSEKPTNLYMVIHIDGKQINIPTGVKVYPHQWNRKKQMPLTSSALSECDIRNNGVIIKKLKDMTKRFNNYKEHLDEHPTEISKAKELAVKIISPKAKKESVFMPTTIIRSGILQNINIKDTTKQQHLSGQKLFEQYLGVRKLSLTSFDMFTTELVTDFQKWPQTEHINPKGRANTVYPYNDVFGSQGRKDGELLLQTDLKGLQDI